MAVTISCEAGPNRSSTFSPGGGVNATVSVSDVPISVTGRRVCDADPSAFASDASTGTTRCAVDSTTNNSPPATTKPDGSASPVAIVVSCPEAGSKRRTAPL